MAFGLVVGLLGTVMPGPAGAAGPVRTATDQISRSLEVPVTNPSDGVSIPSVVLVGSATLSNELPDGSHGQAPNGELYLSLQMSSAPVQRSYGDPLWGRFFLQMAPLPSSAVTFTAQGGRSYAATRINAKTPDPNSTGSDDGLVAAIYYFTVPDSIRSGTVSLGPDQTTGVEYTGFVGGDPTALQVGGPVSFTASFPAALTKVTSPTTTNHGGSSSASVTSSSSGMRTLLIVLLLVAGGGAVLVLTRRRRRTDEPAPAAATTSESEPEAAEVPPVAEPPKAPEVPIDQEEVLSPTLRIKVLGALELEPSVPGLSDPARSLLCYLAFHRDRPMARGEIQSALWPTSSTVKDVTPATFRNYVSEARKAVGAGVLPEASRGADYRLVGFTTDFDEFNELARQARGGDEEASIDLRLQALRLVREAPFAGEVSSFFEWAHFEGLTAEVSRTVSDLAYRTALDCRRTGKTEAAELALRTGLLVAPAMTVLWEELVDLVHERDGEAGLAGLWPQIEAQLGVDGVERLQSRVTD